MRGVEFFFLLVALVSSVQLSAFSAFISGFTQRRKQCEAESEYFDTTHGATFLAREWW
jgi:hypothetical protein